MGSAKLRSEKSVHVKEETRDTGAYLLNPIGFIRSGLRTRREAPKQGCEGAPDAWLEVAASFAQGLDGLSAGDEIIIITWLHRARRDVLKGAPTMGRAPSAHRGVRNALARPTQPTGIAPGTRHGGRR
jgi:tRNA (Thr-GGU) A37 N-methylase